MTLTNCIDAGPYRQPSGCHRHDRTGSAPDSIASAAEDLARCLESLARHIGTRVTPKRVRYGHGRIGNFARRRSPSGFVVDSVNLQMLLPDGRLWSYSHGEHLRFPAGRFYDARADHPAYAAGRIYPGGVEFIFLGALIGKYSFGYMADGAQNGLCALVSEGFSVSYVDAARAFGDLAHSLGGRLTNS